MLNINRGHNEKLKGLCKSLKDYSEYTARVREYADTMPISEAVEQAICECIQEGILAEFLKQNRAEAKQDRKSTRLNSSHLGISRMPSSA